ncbi:hypothetical protein [Paenibacillus tengchongensis]|uniref:hypothetical protein n=1 Tax=Paenibacillus tengchongensis TaxID=2608684 RepID=UPI00124EF5EE|nr:hypothetical protein [Paenibacillus tengchongensis]
MSDFIQEIVTGVLQRNRTAGPAAAGAPAASLGTPVPGGYPQPPAPGDVRTLPVKRVNYQKERAGKRLAPIAGSTASPLDTPLPGSGSPAPAEARHSGNTAASAAAPGPGYGCASPPGAMLSSSAADVSATAPLYGGPSSIAAPPPAAGPAEARRLAADNLSPLLLRTLPAAAGTGGGTPPASGRSPESAIAGSLPDAREPLRLQAGSFTDAWLFPELTGELRQLLGSPGRNYNAAGVISSSSCRPGQLFAVEEILADTAGLEPDIRWGGESGFELKLFGSESALLRSKLQALADRLRQEDSAASARVYTSAAPSPLLRRHFGAGQQEAIAIVASGSRWSSIGVVEQWRHRHSASGVSISAERNYCLLSGSAAQIAAAVSQLNAIIAGA